MKPQRPVKPKPINFIRNNTPLPNDLPVQFEITLGVDMSALSTEEIIRRDEEARTNFIEAWLLQQAQKEPDGHYAMTYFTKTS